jgi:hypothetical protein
MIDGKINIVKDLQGNHFDFSLTVQIRLKLKLLVYYLSNQNDENFTLLFVCDTHTISSH